MDNTAWLKVETVIWQIIHIYDIVLDIKLNSSIQSDKMIECYEESNCKDHSLLNYSKYSNKWNKIQRVDDSYKANKL